MQVSTVIDRALSALAKGTVYSSPGRMPSFSAHTWPHKAKNDCSGYVSWCLRFSESRKVDHSLYRRVNGGWFETTAIHRDGEESTGYFSKQARPMPGSLLVYPDAGGNDGHIGLVLEAKGMGIAGASKVIHCSAGNYRQHGDAIQITGPNAWLARKDSIIVWYDDLAA
jgi:hypothetical protein